MKMTVFKVLNFGNFTYQYIKINVLTATIHTCLMMLVLPLQYLPSSHTNKDMYVEYQDQMVHLCTYFTHYSYIATYIPVLF